MVKTPKGKHAICWKHTFTANTKLGLCSNTPQYMPVSHREHIKCEVIDCKQRGYEYVLPETLIALNLVDPGDVWIIQPLGKDSWGG